MSLESTPCDTTIALDFLDSDLSRIEADSQDAKKVLDLSDTWVSAEMLAGQDVERAHASQEHQNMMYLQEIADRREAFRLANKAQPVQILETLGPGQFGNMLGPIPVPAPLFTLAVNSRVHAGISVYEHIEKRKAQVATRETMSEEERHSTPGLGAHLHGYKPSASVRQVFSTQPQPPGQGPATKQRLKHNAQNHEQCYKQPTEQDDQRHGRDDLEHEEEKEEEEGTELKAGAKEEKESAAFSVPTGEGNCREDNQSALSVPKCDVCFNKKPSSRLLCAHSMCRGCIRDLCVHATKRPNTPSNSLLQSSD